MRDHIYSAHEISRESETNDKNNTSALLRK